MDSPTTKNSRTLIARLFQLAAAFLLFMPLPRAQQYKFDANCQRAYASILSLRFSEAQQLIALEKKMEPGNLLPLYLENYIDFLTLIIGEDRTFSGSHDWLAEYGTDITILDDERCVAMMTAFIAENPALWNEDIGVAEK